MNSLNQVLAEMDSITLLITLLSIGLSFIFGLVGVGSAAVLIPVLAWPEVRFSLDRPTDLFVSGWPWQRRECRCDRPLRRSVRCPARHVRCRRPAQGVVD